MNVTSTEVKLFAIRYEINWAIQTQNTTHIIVITNTISAAKQIFDMSNHFYQLHSITIFSNLKGFF